MIFGPEMHNMKVKRVNICIKKKKGTVFHITFVLVLLKNKGSKGVFRSNAIETVLVLQGTCQGTVLNRTVFLSVYNILPL